MTKTLAGPALAVLLLFAVVSSWAGEAVLVVTPGPSEDAGAACQRRCAKEADCWAVMRVEWRSEGSACVLKIVDAGKRAERLRRLVLDWSLDSGRRPEVEARIKALLRSAQSDPNLIAGAVAAQTVLPPFLGVEAPLCRLPEQSAATLLRLTSDDADLLAVAVKDAQTCKDRFPTAFWHVMEERAAARTRPAAGYGKFLTIFLAALAAVNLAAFAVIAGGRRLRPAIFDRPRIGAIAAVIAATAVFIVALPAMLPLVLFGLGFVVAAAAFFAAITAGIVLLAARWSARRPLNMTRGRRNTDRPN